MDIQTREIQDWVWLFGLTATPLTCIRFFISGLFFLYIIQVLGTFGVMLLLFHSKLIGGADGKAILILSLSYPWLGIDGVMLLLAPYIVLGGAFLITGIHCVLLAIQNLYNWQRYKTTKNDRVHPQRLRFWFSRKLSDSSKLDGVPIWKTQTVPLILYCLIAYLILLLAPQIVWLI
jgi:Flp pilus assembly protein protease CpaA